eukprot:40843-Chlamydomonas_euryale.AAC.4
MRAPDPTDRAQIRDEGEQLMGMTIPTHKTPVHTLSRSSVRTSDCVLASTMRSAHHRSSRSSEAMTCVGASEDGWQVCTLKGCKKGCQGMGSGLQWLVALCAH